MIRKRSAEEALIWLREQLPDAARLYAPGCSGEALMFASAFATRPDLAAHLSFLGVWIPGVNRTDYANLQDTARAETIFMSPDLRQSFDRGKTSFLPLSYIQAWSWLETTPIDAALFQVAPPDRNSNCSLGVSADFSPAIAQRTEIIKIAHINPMMPAIVNAPTIALDDFDLIVEAPAPLLQYQATELPAVYAAIAANIARLIKDGDCLQFGLGNVQLATSRALHKHRNLTIHSGMICDPILDGIDAGIFRSDPGSITTGVALGTDALYARCAQDARIRFEPVSYTHASKTLSSIENFTAINSAIEVDLFGQANAEHIGGRLVSGTGGLVDYLRGAALAPGGKPIIALCSTARGRTVSRIVGRLDSPTVSINRADVGLVVTEHGIADLRGKSMDERAKAIIAIADPAHRDDLRRQWTHMRDGL